jgi:hypothetical protein
MRGPAFAVGQDDEQRGPLTRLFGGPPSEVALDERPSPGPR